MNVLAFFKQIIGLYLCLCSVFRVVCSPPHDSFNNGKKLMPVSNRLLAGCQCNHHAMLWVAWELHGNQPGCAKINNTTSSLQVNSSWLTDVNCFTWWFSPYQPQWTRCSEGCCHTVQGSQETGCGQMWHHWCALHTRLEMKKCFFLFRMTN